jgi:translation initiation factor 1
MYLFSPLPRSIPDTDSSVRMNTNFTIIDLSVRTFLSLCVFLCIFTIPIICHYARRKFVIALPPIRVVSHWADVISLGDLSAQQCLPQANSDAIRSLCGCARSRHWRDYPENYTNQYVSYCNIPKPTNLCLTHTSIPDIHIRIQQRNGRKTLTTIEGIPSKFDLKKILKVIKKQFACNGTIVNDEKAGDVIQLQGDQRNAVKEFLVDKEKGLEIDPKTIKVCFLLTISLIEINRYPGPWLLIGPMPNLIRHSA